MLLTAPYPKGSEPVVPLSLLEEVGRLLSKHEAVRVDLRPEDESVTLTEASRLLTASEEQIGELLTLGVIKGAQRGVDLSSLVAFKKRCESTTPRNSLDEFFDELEEAGLY